MLRPLAIAAVLTGLAPSLAVAADPAGLDPRWLKSVRAEPGWVEAPSMLDENGPGFVRSGPLDKLDWPIAQAWVRGEFAKPGGPDGATPYRSTVALNRVDCEARRAATLAFADYAKPNLKGKVLDSGAIPVGQEDKIEWYDGVPDSYEATVIDAICPIASVQRAQAAAGASNGPRPAFSADDLLETYRSLGKLGEPYVLLHDLFPTEWEVFSARVIRLSARDDAQLGEFYAGFMQDFVTSRMRYVEKAPEPSLRAMASASVVVLKLLRARSPQACASYAIYGEVTPDLSTLSDTEKGAMAAFLSAQLRAVRQGMDKPVTYAAATDGDLERFAKTFLSDGGTAGQWRALYEGGSEALSPKDQCDASTHFLAAIANAPEVTAGRVASWYFSPDETPEREEADDAEVTPATVS